MLCTDIISGVTRVITKEPMIAAQILAIIEKVKVTKCSIPPSTIAELNTYLAEHNSDLSSLAEIATGGVDIPINEYQTFRTFYKGQFRFGYGLTEVFTAIAVTYNPVQSHCAGYLESGTRAKILNDAGEPLGPSESGNVYIGFQQPIKYLGYLNNEAATKETFLADGWVNTGDGGYFNADGELFLSGRKKHMFTSKNVSITPAELEGFIYKNFDVKEVVIVGIPNEEDQHHAAAIIVRSQTNPCLTEEAVSKLFAESFIPAKQLLGGVYFVNDLPKTLTGKYMRGVVLEMAVELHNK